MKAIRLLIVDDDDVDREQLRRLLRRADLATEVVEASTGREALEHLRKMEFDCLLLDYRLGDTLGTDLLAEIEASGLPTCPVIMITGQNSERSAVEAMRRGVYDYLPKHRLERDQLVSAIEGSLRWRELQAELRESQDRFRQLAESLPQLVWTCGPDGRCDYVNRQWVNYTGIEAAEQRGGEWLSRSYPDDRASLTQAWNAAVASGSDFKVELRLRRHDGLYRWFDARVVPLRDGKGQLVKWIGSNTEVHEAREMREAVREAGELNRQIIQNAGEGIVVLDRNLCCLAWNRLMEEMTGRTAGDAIGKRADQLAPLLREQGLYELLERALAGESVTSPDLSCLMEQTGKSSWLVGKTVPLRSADGEIIGVIATIRDITQRKQAEEALLLSEQQLVQAQKMEAIGRLAGGVAHDFNNLLTVVNAHAELALLHVHQSDPLRKDLEEILKAGDRAAALTRQLLAFSRRQVLQPQVINLNKIVADMEQMLRRLIGEDIELRTTLASDAGSVKADRSQIEQVIMNLVVNSRDAMPAGGKLLIETSNVVLDKDYASQHLGLNPGPSVCLSVTDTGAGMDSETQARIFEPFFTTKELGRGTGLGLATVYGIVKQSGGSVWVYSETGRGTTFKIYLPRELSAGEATAPVATFEEHVGGSETILLVEDEEGVRNLLQKILTTAGYKVISAANGGEALLLCQHHSEPIQLVLTDVIMPLMSGRELVEQLMVMRPGMKVLYASGYTDDAIVHHGVLEQGTRFIAKPFTVAEVRRKVREVLDEAIPGELPRPNSRPE